jgi:hypothetical protein
MLGDTMTTVERVYRHHHHEGTLLSTGRVTAVRTRIPKLIAEINTIIADRSGSESKEEREAIDLLKRARHTLGLARAKLQEADLKKNRVA